MIDTVRFREYGGMTPAPEFVAWAKSNLDDGEYVSAYDICSDEVLFRCISSDDWRPRRWRPLCGEVT